MYYIFFVCVKSLFRGVYFFSGERWGEIIYNLKLKKNERNITDMLPLVTDLTRLDEALVRIGAVIFLLKNI